MDADSIGDGLAAYLQGLTTTASEAVQDQPLPDDIPLMLREVLEQKREYGSDSTFVCGRIDLPGPSFPSGRVVLAWIGDSRLRIWGPQGERTAELGDTFKMAERWSSSRGPVGSEPHVFVSNLKQDGHYTITRLLVYSDGLSVIDRYERELSNVALQDLVDESGEAATSDDVSVLELWLTGLPPRVVAKALAPPQSLITVLQDGKIRASWQPMPGAARYQMEVRRELRPQTPTQYGNGEKSSERKVIDLLTPEWVSPNLPAGAYKLRARAWDDSGPSGWTDVFEVEIPALAKETAFATSPDTKPLEGGAEDDAAEGNSRDILGAGSTTSAEWDGAFISTERHEPRNGEAAVAGPSAQASALVHAIL